MSLIIFRRKFHLDQKNLFYTSPATSPLLKMRQSLDEKKTSSTNDKSLTFISLPPLLTGFARTLKSIGIAQKGEFVMPENDDNEASLIHTSLLPNDWKMISKICK